MIAREHLYDIALRKFVTTHDCPVSHLVHSEPVCRHRRGLIQQLLHSISYQAIALRIEIDRDMFRETIETLVQMINEIKNLNDQNSSNYSPALSSAIDAYTEVLADTNQCAVHSIIESKSRFRVIVEGFMNETAQFVEQAQETLTPTWISKIVEDYERRIEVKEMDATRATRNKSISDEEQSSMSPTSTVSVPPLQQEEEILVRSEAESTNRHASVLEDSNKEITKDHQTIVTSSNKAGDEDDGAESPHKENEIADLEDDAKNIDNDTNDKPADKLSPKFYVAAKKRKKHVFSPTSDAKLITGVKRFGRGKWKKIFDHLDFPPYRKPAHLKDRWRTLQEKGDVLVSGGSVVIQGTVQRNAFNKLAASGKLSKSSERLEQSSSSITLSRGNDAFASTSNTPTICLKDINKNDKLLEKNTSLNEDNRPDLGESGNSLPNNSEPKETLLVDNEADMSPVSGGKTLSPVKSAKKVRKRRIWDGSGEALKWDEEEPTPLFASSRSKTRTKKPWTDWEEENLIKGVRRYGKGCWAMILDQYRFQNRSAIMLKDKFRNLSSSNRLPRDLL
ncbi:uncharacterized protein LOC143450384 isoform X2 [Clavelina lepadiformis]|uniref:uncharacterized protein LOC143450384 isoform X2 n=1 Tax=Clavelina lepadiformis TaxID=159417 RepID=UPI0040416C98